MAEVEIVSTEGNRLVVAGSRAYGQDPWSFDVRMEAATASAGATVWDWSNGLGQFFADLASRWRGFEGTLSYTSLEGELSIDAHHDGIGLVVCEVTLGTPIPPAWCLTAQFSLGAGAQLEEIADGLTHMYLESDPTRRHRGAPEANH